jgi:hypothetical protein
MDNIKNVSNCIKYGHFQKTEGLVEIGTYICMFMSIGMSRNWIQWNIQ